MRILVTGGAGFIGSNLVETLIEDPGISLVRVLDNLSTGNLMNIEKFFDSDKFEFVEGDIRDLNICQVCCKNIDAITHQAALGSVPRSINDPITSHEVNTTGFLNILESARQNGIMRIVYASSSSVYGDSKKSPKIEAITGNVLSPYAASKMTNELYAEAFSRNFNMQIFGFRYFNVFGPKQNPQGPYAAVIPLFIKAVLDNEPPLINGDGEHSRDFTYVGNAVHANEVALFAENKEAVNQVYNIAFGEQTSLNGLFQTIKEIAGSDLAPKYGPERAGDVKHSLADISKARTLLEYDPSMNIREGLKIAFEWYRRHHNYSYSV